MKKIALSLIIAFSVANLTACDKIKELTGYQSSDNDSQKNIIESKQKINSKRVALLIANKDYKKQEEIQPLKNPINDLELIEKKLIKLGYQVETLKNATEKQMSRAIKKFGKDAKNADSAIFYYSGHGMQDEARRNFFIPVDAQIESDADIETDGVDAYKVIEALKKAKPRLSLVLFDACRNNPFVRSRGYRSFSNMGYQLDSELLISYSTQTGKFALDGDGDNSPYALAVANQLEKAQTTAVLSMFDGVKREVKSRTHGEQSPTKMGDVEVKTMLFSSEEEGNNDDVKDDNIKDDDNANIEETSNDETENAVDEKENTKAVLTRFEENGKWGYKRNGKVFILPQYDGADSFSEGLANVIKDGKEGFINKQGEVVIPLQYDGAYDFNEGLAGVYNDGKWGFINKQGEVVIPCQYDFGIIFSEGLAKVAKNNQWGFINKQGEVIIPLQYDDVWDFSEGLASVKKDGKWGFINKQGEVVIPLQYDYAYRFSEGLDSVKKDGKWGFINKQGKVVIPLQYDSIMSFKNGKAKVEKDGEKFYINKQGKRVD